jgi:hypothetical protein
VLFLLIVRTRGCWALQHGQRARSAEGSHALENLAAINALVCHGGCLLCTGAGHTKPAHDTTVVAGFTSRSPQLG